MLQHDEAGDNDHRKDNELDHFQRTDGAYRVVKRNRAEIDEDRCSDQYLQKPCLSGPPIEVQNKQTEHPRSEVQIAQESTQAQEVGSGLCCLRRELIDLRQEWCEQNLWPDQRQDAVCNQAQIGDRKRDEEDA